MPVTKKSGGNAFQNPKVAGKRHFWKNAPKKISCLGSKFNRVDRDRTLYLIMQAF